MSGNAYFCFCGSALSGPFDSCSACNPNQITIQDLESESALLRQENETLKRELADVRARMERKDVALRAVIPAALILLQNAEGCAVNHHGADFAVYGRPGWLADCARSIESARAALQEGTG